MLRSLMLVTVLVMPAVVSHVHPAPAHATTVRNAPRVALDRDTAELAAIVYAEAQTRPVVFDEMLAIASVVRNRVEHVAIHPADIRWFGGPGYHAVLSNRVQFPSYRSPRYRNFMAGTIGSGVEQAIAEHATRAAVLVRNGGSPYPFVFFQRGATRPSLRAASPATHLGAHNFWSFRPGCVNPLRRCPR